jgi:ParB family chromosome partitioning protein
LVENLQRADLNAMEEAEAYRSLQDRFELTQDAIAERVGRARTTITNSLRLLRLPPAVQDLLRSGAITPGQARPLLAIDSPRRQIELAEKAARDGMSARRMEALAAAPAGRTSVARGRSRPDVHTAAAEEALTRALQTRVEIRRSGKGGTVRIHFHSEEELIRLHETLVDRR